MMIQCPECRVRYRAKNIGTGQRAVRLKCPSCTHVFSFTPPATVEEQTADEQSVPLVLVVDDARFFREIIIEILAPLGLQLVTVESAAEARQELQHRNFQLVLVDLNLPDMNGLELIRLIRSDAKLTNLKVLAISGAYRKDDCEGEAIRAGADSFLSKSFKPDDLQQRIRTLLGL